MGEKADNIAEIVQKNFPDDSYFLVDIKIQGSGGKEKIVILVDGDNGISIDTCSSISRAVSNALDGMDIFDGEYTLEVSSPGIDFPLKSVRQYRKNQGKQIMIVFHDNKNLRGELVRVDDQGVGIKKERGSKKESSSEIYIPYNEIKKSKILVTFK